MNRSVISAALAAAAMAFALPAVAQVVPLPGQPWPNAVDQARYQADRHRYEMERLRLEADQREAFARQQALEARLRVMELRAARQPTPPEAYAPYTTGGPEQARARREAVVTGTTQIDDWLDRGPRCGPTACIPWPSVAFRPSLQCGRAGERSDALAGWTSRRRH